MKKVTNKFGIELKIGDVMKEETENYIDDNLLNADDNDPFLKINEFIES